MPVSYWGVSYRVFCINTQLAIGLHVGNFCGANGICGSTCACPRETTGTKDRNVIVLCADSFENSTSSAETKGKWKPYHKKSGLQGQTAQCMWHCSAPRCKIHRIYVKTECSQVPNAFCLVHSAADAPHRVGTFHADQSDILLNSYARTWHEPIRH